MSGKDMTNLFGFASPAMKHVGRQTQIKGRLGNGLAVGVAQLYGLLLELTGVILACQVNSCILFQCPRFRLMPNKSAIAYRKFLFPNAEAYDSPNQIVERAFATNYVIENINSLWSNQSLAAINCS